MCPRRSRFTLPCLLFVCLIPAFSRAATYTVSIVANAGPGSLRAAIIAANTNPGSDEIDFNIPGAGPHLITITTPLPEIVEAVFINGYSEPGSSPNTLPSDTGTDAVLKVEVRRDLIGPLGSCFVVNTDATEIKGLSITGWRRAGIEIAGAGNCVISGNFIGVDVSGTAAYPCSVDVWISDGTGNTIGGPGVASVNVIGGGTFPVACVKGIVLSGNSKGNIIRGNLIGLGRLASTLGGFRESGIYVGAGAARNRIGAAVGGGRNFICGSLLEGLYIDSDSNDVYNNFIGTDISGTMAIGNGRHNIYIHAGTGNLIGGHGALQGNLIRFAGDVGVAISAVGANSTGNFLHGNAIYENSLLGLGVSGLGIDLAPVGVTLNDAGDPDVGVNNLQNFPVLLCARRYASGDLLISGYIESTPNRTFDIDFFSNDACDPSGWGEGQRFLTPCTDGACATTTDAHGFGCFTERLTDPGAALGDLITSTATGITGTSEFSKCGLRVKPLAVSPVLVNWTDGPLPGQTLVWTSVKNETAELLPQVVGELSIIVGDSIATVTDGSTNYGAIPPGMTAVAEPFLIENTGPKSLIVDLTYLVNYLQASDGLDASPSTDTTAFAILIDPATPTGIRSEGAAPQLFLDQNVPNPFQTWTSIGFEMPDEGPARVRIYDVSGAIVRTLVAGRRAKGYHTVVWDGRTDAGAKAGSGVYFYELKTPTARATRRMVLLK